MADRRRRFTIEVYPDEELIIRKLRRIGFDLDIPVRELVIKAIQNELEKLEKLDAAEKGKGKK